MPDAVSIVGIGTLAFSTMLGNNARTASAVNRRVVGSNPTESLLFIIGSHVWFAEGFALDLEDPAALCGQDLLHVCEIALAFVIAWVEPCFPPDPWQEPSRHSDANPCSSRSDGNARSNTL